MPKPWRRRQILKLLLAALPGVMTSGCGTIIYPERRGQAAGPFDWRVVVMDSLLLLCFFIPGVIAFAVDFSTGAIYLPEWDGPDCGPVPGGEVTRIDLGRGRATRAAIEAAISKHLRRPIRLEDGTFETQELANLDEMNATILVMKADVNQQVLRCQSPAS
jgi:hypothetical protein